MTKSAAHELYGTSLNASYKPRNNAIFLVDKKENFFPPGGRDI